jgi:hypothetical protein
VLPLATAYTHPKCAGELTAKSVAFVLRTSGTLDWLAGSTLAARFSNPPPYHACDAVVAVSRLHSSHQQLYIECTGKEFGCSRDAPLTWLGFNTRVAALQADDSLARRITVRRLLRSSRNSMRMDRQPQMLQYAPHPQLSTDLTGSNARFYKSKLHDCAGVPRPLHDGTIRFAMELLAPAQSTDLVPLQHNACENCHLRKVRCVPGQGQSM